MADLQEEIRRRIEWFYETQLRGLNFNAFRGARAEKRDAILKLVSERFDTVVFPSRFGELKDVGSFYLDSGKPVWTEIEAHQRGAFADSLLGRVGDWLDAREPRRLAERLKALRDELENSTFASAIDPLPLIGQFPRRPPGEKAAVAISRAELAAAKPWLIPELYSFIFPGPEDTSDKAPIRAWVANLEQFVNDFEAELLVSVGAIPGTEIPDSPDLYREFIKFMLDAAPNRRVADAVKVGIVELRKIKPDDPTATYVYEPSIRLGGAAATPVDKFQLSKRTAYWANAFGNSLKECVAIKPNSDMGLCELVRLLYLYGTLPGGLGSDEQLTWRRRQPPGATYRSFMDDRVKAIGDEPELVEKFRKAEAKLRIILQESAARPRGPDPCFSPLAGEILKQGLLSYKYWMDERPRALENERLNKVKRDLGYPDEVDLEMEFWSENHYIMFASSEYLLGQLWEDETFQPCRLFADPKDRTGERSGTQRRERGRARVLKWLNNRLMFGWMEFNSSGYYREHLWAILNLADFALDEEVRTKAIMVVDLMLFDVARFMHRGAMGAAGGRSQFKSRSHGVDNGLSDVVEIIFGAKGVFSDGDSQIGASFATSTYVVPRVLLEIGLNPPAKAFTDRSRVSITFEEAAKHGITWSQDSTTKDSLFAGYASKRARHSAFLDELNQEIARTHDDYGAVEDDTVFFWGMSAFVNKQVVRNSFRLMRNFGLDKVEAFAMPRLIVKLVSFFKAPESQLIGFSLLDLPDRALDAISGNPHDEIDESTADDLSVVFEGSTRTRANILTYRSPGVMQSSIQNFRPGQLNFQSSVQQVTLNGALTVFVNAGFGDIDMSEVMTFAAGFVVGAAAGSLLGPVGAVVGSLAGGVGALVGQQEALEDTNPLNPKHDDGPDWWTGNWALPRMIQHEGAAIMLSDFHEIQEFLAETGSHCWFPKSGFDQVVERRTSAYDDANFPLLDIGHIGAKGFWLFGKTIHPVPAGSTDEAEEGYVGVFSNSRPEWLTKESPPYDHRLEQRIAKDEEEKKGDFWKVVHDHFTDRDWYVNGKNVWIVQVGSRSEYGNFEAFMDRVSSARVHIDDVGDLECTYDSPRPDGTSFRLRLTNGDEPAFELNGQPLATDLFPRFETPFVRGGLIEWQQRTYCLDWNTHRLLHDFSDMRRPVRREDPRFLQGDSSTIEALVIYFHTGDEAMEAFTVATATVVVGCEKATEGQTVAAGPSPEGSAHDAEWIYFDRPLRRSPDMTIEITHPTSGGNPLDLGFLDPTELDPRALLGPLAIAGQSGIPEWKASFRLKALMGDYRLRDCSLVHDQLEFEDERRSSGPRSFSVQLSEWEKWTPVGGAVEASSWALAAHPPWSSVWHDHNDLFVIDPAARAWHRRTSFGGTRGFWTEFEADEQAPHWRVVQSLAAVNDPSGRALLFALAGGVLAARISDAMGRWSEQWMTIEPQRLNLILPEPVPLDASSTLTAIPVTGFSGGLADLYLIGADGAVYLREGWYPGDPGFWRRFGTPDFSIAPNSRLQIVGRRILARSDDGELWVRDRDELALFGGAWERIDNPGFAAGAFAAAGTDDVLRLAARGPSGEVSLGERSSGGAVTWRVPAAEDGWQPAVSSELAWAELNAGEAWLFATGADGSVRGFSNSDEVWRPLGFDAPKVMLASQLATTSRTAGQIELFAETEERSLSWTWWS